MCEFCKSIIECPVGEKRSVTLAEFDNEYTGRKMRSSMVKDKISEEKVNTFIHTEYADENSWQNIVIEDVLFCPKCGAKLKELEGEKCR